MKRTVLALGLVLGTAISAPAMAGGTVSFNVNPRNGDEARAVQRGLTMYQHFKGGSAGGVVSQNGRNNFAALRQRGNANVGIIRQEGRDHDASLSQSGNGNSYGVFQFGKGTRSNVTQTGNGQTGLLFQYGF